jgi:hypothetical protein
VPDLLGIFHVAFMAGQDTLVYKYFADLDESFHRHDVPAGYVMDHTTLYLPPAGVVFKFKVLASPHGFEITINGKAIGTCPVYNPHDCHYDRIELWTADDSLGECSLQLVGPPIYSRELPEFLPPLKLALPTGPEQPLSILVLPTFEYSNLIGRIMDRYAVKYVARDGAETQIYFEKPGAAEDAMEKLVGQKRPGWQGVRVM